VFALICVAELAVLCAAASGLLFTTH
jgi:hypothetical protein